MIYYLVPLQEILLIHQNMLLVIWFVAHGKIIKNDNGLVAEIVNLNPVT
jgi:hypothetical protein